MPVVIGGATTVIFGAGTEEDSCIVSANWGFNNNPQRLYCLGSWQAYDTYNTPQETLSLTMYAGNDVPAHDILPTNPTGSCESANTIYASVDPATCGGAVDGVSGYWFVTSYSYSKDDGRNPGQESWSLMHYTGTPGESAPDYNLRGISEGQTSDPSLTGIVFDPLSVLITSTTGSVSAGGIGTADTMESGEVIQVGGSLNTAGARGNGSVSIPYTPLWVS